MRHSVKSIVKFIENMNRYTLLEKLGDGGYGSVYKCRDQIGVRYACKVIPKNTYKRERVQQELEALEKLQRSTRVTRLIDAQEDDQSFYIIQEWCKGGALRDYVKSAPQLYGENTVASIVRGTLRGLCHVHRAELVHRDIKGGNILFADVTPDADIKLADFGASIECDTGPNQVVESQNLVGTPWFVSPEGLSHKFGYKSDIWSLGVLTYQLLCGKMPFNDKEEPHSPKLSAIYRSIFTDDPNMKGRVWDSISPDAKDFVRRCLKKELHERPMAEDALSHPWLTKSDCADRFTGTALELVCTPFEFESFMHARTLY